MAEQLHKDEMIGRYDAAIDEITGELQEALTSKLRYLPFPAGQPR